MLQQDTGNSAGNAAVPGGGTLTEAALEMAEQSETVSPALAKIKEMLTELNSLFGPSVKAWTNAFEGLKGPVSDAYRRSEGCGGDLWKNSLVPWARMSLQTLFPNVTNGFSETFAPIFADVLTSAVGQWAQNFQLGCQLVGDAINTFVLPLVQLLESVLLGMFSGISNAWNEYGAPILAAWEEQQANLRTLWESLYYGVIQPVLQGNHDRAYMALG